MRDLPYFRWWVARAETDENYGSMTDQELGFYHRCLNKSWVNDGLPADQETLSRLMRVSREYLESVWPAVGKCWYEDGARLRNKTQEEERAYALGKSVQSSSAAAARERKKIARSSVDTSVDTSNGHPRAYDSDSVSESLSLPKKKKEIEIAMPDRFSEWLKPWPRCASPDDAAQAWLSVVNSGEDEEGAFAARDRYLASDEVFRGAVKEPQRWLFEQKRSNWAGVWIPARKNGTAATEDLAASIEAFRRTRTL